MILTFIFQGWPKLHWFITEHLPRPPKDWNPPPRLTDDTPAYVEYTTQQDGSVLGVSVSRTAMLAHARTLTLACNYTEGEIMVCVLDFKRDVGLWHGVLASVFNGMHVIFIPYALMKVSIIFILYSLSLCFLECLIIRPAVFALKSQC